MLWIFLSASKTSENLKFLNSDNDFDILFVIVNMFDTVQNHIWRLQTTNILGRSFQNQLYYAYIVF